MLRFSALRRIARPRPSVARRGAAGWRFLEPLPPGPLNVCFAGERHFLAALPLTREKLPEDEVQITQVPAAELPEALRTADVAVPFMERLDASLLEGAPQLRLVIQFGVGVEGVDRAACDRLGIALSNAPAATTGNAASTAEHAVFLTLALLRRGVRDLAGRFEARVLGGLPLPRALAGKRVLVIGAGAVGTALEARLRNWDADVVLAHAHRAGRPGEAVSRGGRAAILDALPACDVVILCAPLTAETECFVEEEFCRALRPGACLVSVGRGPVVSRDAVLGALERDGELMFASDVGAGAAGVASEPWDPRDALSSHPRAYFTPHVGGYTDVSYANVSSHVAAAIQRIRQREPPDVWLNRDRDGDERR